jgi:hypothetical protein
MYVAKNKKGDTKTINSGTANNIIYAYCYHQMTILNYNQMALQLNLGPGLLFCGYVTITLLQGWIVSPVPNTQPAGPGLRIYDTGDRVDQLYPQTLGTHFSCLLRHAVVTVGIFFNPGHHTGAQY